jgi:aconitate hydratase
MPGRVVLQDFTGVPCVVDLAAMRDGDEAPRRRPEEDQPARARCDLVIDHSVQVDHFGHARRAGPPINARDRVRAQRERYEFLKWGQQAFDNFRVVPPAPASSTRSTSSTSPASC